MSCEEFRDSLQDYVTRQLESERRRQVDSHLLECEDCQRELAIMTAVVSSLDHQPVLEPSADFASKVLGNLPRQRSFYPSPWWAVVLAPILAGVAWLFRGALEQGLAAMLGRISVGNVALPTITLQQAGIGALAVILGGLAIAVGAGAYAWQTYLRD